MDNAKDNALSAPWRATHGKSMAFCAYLFTWIWLVVRSVARGTSLVDAMAFGFGEAVAWSVGAAICAAIMWLLGYGRKDGLFAFTFSACLSCWLVWEIVRAVSA